MIASARRFRGAVAVTSAALLVTGCVLGILGAAPSEAATTRVTYLAGGSVYVDAGRLEGLGLGDTLVVARQGADIAWLKVTFLSSHRASCDTLAVREVPGVGDLVRFTPRAVFDPGGAAAAAPSGGTAAPDSAAAWAGTGAGAWADTSAGAGGRREGAALDPKPKRTSGRLRGRAGVRLLAVQSAGGGSFTQPALDLRADQADVGGRLDLALDLRGRRTITSGALALGTNHGAARVYRLSGTVHDRSGAWRLTAGRQSSSGFASVSLFDGVLGEARFGRATVRLFSGTQPEPIDMRLSGEILEHGGGVEWRADSPGGARRASVDLGAVTSHHGGEANRDFGFLQGYYATRRAYVSASQELDLARGWRRQAGEPAVALTSTFASGRFSVTDKIDLSAGYDNRRNVRLWRDRETPADQFDDRYRQGVWLGAATTPRRWLRVSGDARLRDHGAGDRTWIESGALEFLRLTRYLVTIRARTSWVDGAFSDAALHSLALGIDPSGDLHAEVASGIRVTREPALDLEERVGWENAEADWALARRWYLMASFERTHGGASGAHQEYAGLSWRF